MTPKTRVLVSLLVPAIAAIVMGFVLLVSRPKAAIDDVDEAHANTLAVLWPVPDFSLTERDGRTIARDSLIGRVWIADFIFTNCANTCPVMTSQMKRVDDELPAAVGSAGQRPALVSFSVDPDRDTPAALTAYADRIGASPDWLFLTGDRKIITTLAVNGFKLAATDQPEDFTHSSRLILIDRDMHIRGFYDGMDGESVDRLVRDAVRLVKGEP